MLSDEEKKVRVKRESDVPLRRFILSKSRKWVMFRSNNNYRVVVLFMMFVQFIADIACLLLSFVRGIWTSWAINPILIICAGFGIFGSIRVEPISLFIHAVGCYIGLFIIVVGCLEITIKDSSEAVVWALHAPGIVDLACALLTTFMAASLVQCCGCCGCCSRCCCLHRADDSEDKDVSPSSMEQGNSQPVNAAATTSSQPAQATQARSVASSSSSTSTSTSTPGAKNDVEMKDAATMDAKDSIDEENFDDLDDEAKMLALQKKQQQQQQQ